MIGSPSRVILRQEAIDIPRTPLQRSFESRLAARCARFLCASCATSLVLFMLLGMLACCQMLSVGALWPSLIHITFSMSTVRYKVLTRLFLIDDHHFHGMGQAWSSCWPNDMRMHAHGRFSSSRSSRQPSSKSTVTPNKLRLSVFMTPWAKPTWAKRSRRLDQTDP